MKGEEGVRRRRPLTVVNCNNLEDAMPKYTGIEERMTLDATYNPPTPPLYDEVSEVEGVWAPGTTVNDDGPRVIVGYVVILSLGGRGLVGSVVHPGTIQYRRDIRDNNAAQIVTAGQKPDCLPLRAWVADEMSEPQARLSTLLYRADVPHWHDGKEVAAKTDFFYFYAEETGDYGPAPIGEGRVIGTVDGTPVVMNASGQAEPMSAGTMRPENDGEKLQRLGTDGVLWAAEFSKVARSFPVSGTDCLDPTPGGFIHGWFVNAIEAGRSAGALERSELASRYNDLVRALVALLDSDPEEGDTDPTDEQIVALVRSVLDDAEAQRAKQSELSGELRRMKAVLRGHKTDLERAAARLRREV